MRELAAAGEVFTGEPPPPEATQEGFPTPEHPPRAQLSEADAKRAIAVFGQRAFDALGAVRGDALRICGDDFVCWVERTEVPKDIRPAIPFVCPIVFDGRVWHDVLPGPDRLGTVLATLALALDDRLVRESVLRACDALVGPAIRTEAAAVSLTQTRPEESHYARAPRAAPAEVTKHFEPPHVAGRAFTFCANLVYDPVTYAPSFLRLTLDLDTVKLSVERLCRGRDPGVEFMLRGRPLVAEDGRALHAPLRGPSSSGHPAVRAWREAAAAEHASIASFARATLELMAVGAPLSLVARSHQAALDEVRHARLSLAVARRLAGDESALAAMDDIDDSGVTSETDDCAFGPLPVASPRVSAGPQTSSLALVATTTLVEAAVPETLAALAAGVAARRCRHADVRAALDEIHADETRHAALAWDIVDWCVVRDNDARAAVAALAATIAPPGLRVSTVESDDDGQLSAATEQRCFGVAFHEAVLPRLRGLMERR